MASRPEESTVLVGVDGSNSALGALGWAAEFALDRSCVLRVVHAVPAVDWIRGLVVATIRGEADLRAAQDAVAHRCLAEAAGLARAIAPGITVEEVVSADPLDKHIARRSPDCRLVAVGAHPRSWAGAVRADHVDAVVRAAACPVLVWHDPTATWPGAVVVGCDGSGRDREVLRAGRDMAGHLGTGLVIARFGVDASDSDLTSGDHGDMPVTTVADPCDPVDGLRVLSTTAQMVVVGSRRRGRARRAILGSVSGPMTRQCACPVLVV